jgi:hypothetical protein
MAERTLLDRIDAAIERVVSGRAPMRIPAEETDPDLVLAACKVELERLRWGRLACRGCGGPHSFDTSVPSAAWNAVIRARGLPEFLCLTCIAREFAKAGRSFTAQLWGEEFHGTPIEVRVGERVATDAAAVSEENTRLRSRLSRILDEARAGLDEATAAPVASPLYCHAGMDGDCSWAECPQHRDGEPEKTGRHCPLDSREWGA